MHIKNNSVGTHPSETMGSSASTFSPGVQEFILRLDEAEQAHLAWSYTVLRCAILHTSPGDDVLTDDAHRRCSFGNWFQRNRESFDAIDATSAERLDSQHKQMHDAVRRICKGILDGVAGDPDALSSFETSQARVIAELAFFKTQYMTQSSRLDALTGLPLRYGLEDEFRRSIARSMRKNEKLFVVLLDIDHFKSVNDNYGHAVGDLALQHIARLLAENCRADDQLFRYGGEEFLAFLQTTDCEGAKLAAERLLQSLRDCPMHLPDGQELGLRASAGLTDVSNGERIADVMVRADHALYAAKADGRDTWRLESPQNPD